MDKEQYLREDIVYSEDLINELGESCSDKDRADSLRLAAEQLGSSTQVDDSDDALALRSFLKLPAEAKRRLSKKQAVA